MAVLLRHPLDHRVQTTQENPLGVTARTALLRRRHPGLVGDRPGIVGGRGQELVVVAQLGREAGTGSAPAFGSMVIPAHCFPASEAPMNDRDAEADCGPLAMLGRRRGGRELSKMTVHPENIVSGGRDSPQAPSSHLLESGKRRGKSRALAIFFDKPVRIDSPSRADSMPGLFASPVDDSRPRGGVSGRGGHVARLAGRVGAAGRRRLGPPGVREVRKL